MSIVDCLPAYAQSTTSAPVDPEAHPSGGSPGSPALAAMTRSSHRWPCSRVEAEWVPLREEALVPPELMATCTGCPLRQTCLTGAIERGEYGYWAGTTTADREALRTSGRTSVVDADACQVRVMAHLLDQNVTPSHAPGAAGYRGYRCGCRCPRCRAGNAAARASERARSKRSA